MAIILLIIIFACQNNSDDTGSKDSFLKKIPVQTKESGEPNLFVSQNGIAYLSWVEFLNDTTDALLFSKMVDEQWSKPTKIASGSDWFVNWADFPSLVISNSTTPHLAAHWLQKSASGTYDYDVHITQSKDGGITWSSSFIPHTDRIAAEHGFVTLLPMENGHIFATWLDGRNTKTEEGQEHQHGHGGAMTLRTAEFDQDGNLYEEAELDQKVCDCCQTDAAMTSEGPVVVYRDRSAEEIRDISIVRKVNGKWTSPKKVFADNWNIAGCPVNGPAIVAQDKNLAIAWFTFSEKKAKVNVAFSTDSGASFSKPIEVDDGKPIGRVDIVWLGDNTALVSWMENLDQGAEIRLAKVNTSGKLGVSIPVTKISESRLSGFPILEKIQDKFLMAWTKVDSITIIETAFIHL